MNRVAVITGASSGIGRALCRSLASNYKIFLCGRNLGELEKTASEMETSEKSVEYILLDLNNSDSIQAAAKKILEQTETVELLVNNAGISQRSFSFDTANEVEKKLFQVNYFGPVEFTKLLLPALRKGKESRIAITSSIVGKFGYPLRSSYSAAKHALHGYFESLRLEEKKNGIFVQLLVIGRVQTQVSMNAVTAAGKVYGKMDNGQAEGITSESCAQLIKKALNSTKKEVLIGGKEIWMVRFKKYLPFLFYRIAEKEINHV